VSRLNHGCDVGGGPIGAPARFHIGVSVNPAAPNIDDELRRFDYKVEAGAEFVVTWPVFEVRTFEAFLKRIEPAGLPVVATVLPLESARHAEFMANEVPGTLVPDAILDRMRRVRPDEAGSEGVAIAREIAQELRPVIQGLHIAATSGNDEAALSVIHNFR
jgi:homocysteine S-methyltransferase